MLLRRHGDVDYGAGRWFGFSITFRWLLRRYDHRRLRGWWVIGVGFLNLWAVRLLKSAVNAILRVVGNGLRSYCFTMGYYVLGDQGQKYGPADIATLNVWVSEGRVLPGTMLEEEVSGGKIAAASVAGLQFQPAAPPQGTVYQAPAASNYPRYDQAPQYQPNQYSPTSDTAGKSDFTLALVLAIVSPILSFLLPIGGLISAGYGIRAAFRAKDNGHPMAILVIVLNILAICVWLITRVTGIGRGMFLR